MLMMKAQYPADLVQSALDWADGHANEVDKLKLGSSLFGIPVSKGAPGGPEEGAVWSADKEFHATKAYMMPDINHLLKTGKDSEARKIMGDQLRMTNKEVQAKIKNYGNPRQMPTPAQMKAFRAHASEDAQQQYERLNQ
jgi:hypothetical protein